MRDAHSLRKRTATTDETELHWAGIATHIRRDIGMVWVAKTDSTCVWHSRRFATLFQILLVVEFFSNVLGFARRLLYAHTSFALGQAISCTWQEPLSQPTTACT
jgi:hypothetical protein